MDRESSTTVGLQERVEGTLEQLVHEVGKLREDVANLPTLLHQRDGCEVRTTPKISAREDASIRSGTTEEKKEEEEEEDPAPSRSLRMHESASIMSRARLFYHGTGSQFEFELSSIEDCSQKDFVAATLPMNWPEVVKIRNPAQHQYTVDSLTSASLNVNSVWRGMALYEGLLSIGSEGQHWYAHSAHNLFTRSLRDPNSRLNIALEMLGMLVLVYDLTFVPWALAWEVEIQGLLKAFSYTSLIFWTFDICMSFLRGFYKDGELITATRQVAIHYIGTWFLPDFTIVLCEWASVILVALQRNSDAQGSTDGTKILRLIKLGKLLRLLGALRIVRLARIIEGFLQRSISENHCLVVWVGSLFWFVLWINHMLSCAWFTVGRAAPSASGARWIHFSWTMADGSLTYLEADLLYQYLTALHWSIAQTTLGSMEMMPCNSSERVFNILCLMMGLLFGSTLVSSLSATMVEVQMQGADARPGQGAEAAHAPPLPHGEHRRHGDRAPGAEADHRVLTTNDVVALEMLSPSLRQDLHFEICKPHLLTHPLLQTWAGMDAAWFKKFCSIAVETNFVRAKDEVFVAGSAASSAYCIVFGSCSYLQEPESSAVFVPTTTEVKECAWICESALWSEWTHVGTAEAATPLQLLEMKAERFWEALQGHIVMNTFAWEYCRCYHRRIVAAKPPHASYPTDLEVPFTDYGDLVCSLPHELREPIGVLAVDSMMRKRARAHTSMAMKGFHKLRKEVRTGSSIVVLNGAGEAERVVSVAVLSLTRSDGHTFVQLGKGQAGRHNFEPVADCQLPGSKQLRGEASVDVLERLLSTRLAFLRGKFEISKVEDLTETKESREFGVSTRYMRKVCHATLTGGFHAPQCQVAAAPFDSEGWEGDVVQKFQRRIPNEPVYYSEAEGKGFFHAWLDPSELARFQTSAGESDLKAWLSTLRPPLASEDEGVGQGDCLFPCDPASPSDSDFDAAGLRCI